MLLTPTADLELTGQRLSVEDLAAVAGATRRVTLAASARSRMEAAQRTVENIVAERRIVYGVNTGFGKLSDVHIPASELRQLQVNLVRSHSCGIGSPLSAEETRATMLLRANGLALGYSGARPAIVDLLLAMLDRRVHPVIPEKGSVGASGDLAALAHLSLTIIGEGEAFYSGQRMPSLEALRLAGLQPIELAPKEGLALLNGTQAMAAVGALGLFRAERVARLADVAGAMTLESLRDTPAAFDQRIHALRPHPGQPEAAADRRVRLADS